MDQKKYIFWLIIIAWLGILGMMMLCYGLVSLLGDELIVPTQWFDPRDMFRGEYVRLGYQFSEWQVSGQTDFFEAQRVYVVPLLSGNRMIWINDVTAKRPRQWLYIAAKIASISDQWSNAYSYTVEWDNSGTVRRDIYDSWYGSTYTATSGDSLFIRVCDRWSWPFIAAFDVNLGDDAAWVLDPQCRIVSARIVWYSHTPVRITLAYSPDRYFVQVWSGRVREDRLRDGWVDAIWRVWRGQTVLDRLEMRE